MTTDSIDAILRRPARHWSADGLAELLTGGLLLLWGMAISAQQVWPSGLTDFLAVTVPMLTCAGMAVFHRRLARGLESVKARWIHPRVGYVKLFGPSRARRAAAGLVAGMLAVGAAVALQSHRGAAGWSPLFPLLMGGTWAVAAAILWVRLGIRRFLVYAVLALASGILARQWAPGDLGAGVVLCAVGITSTAGGAIVLGRVLGHPPSTEDEA